MKVRELIKALLAYDMDQHVLVANFDNDEFTPVARVELHEIYDDGSYCCGVACEEKDAGIYYCNKCGVQTVPVKTTFQFVEIQL